LGTDEPGRGCDAGSVYDFHQQSPGGNEVGPAVAGYARAVAGNFLALTEHPDPGCFLQYSNGFIDVVYDEAQVVPSGVAMTRWRLTPLSAAPLEKLDIEVRRQAQHGKRELGICRYVEVGGHEFFVRPAVGKVQFLGAQDLDEEADAFFKVGNRQTKVVGVLESRQTPERPLLSPPLLRGPEAQARGQCGQRTRPRFASRPVRWRCDPCLQWAAGWLSGQG